MWTCKKCNEKIEDNFDECWNCFRDDNPLEGNTDKSTSKKSSISDIIDYTKERDVFWLKRYPTSRILYRILQILTILMQIIFVIGSIYILVEIRSPSEALIVFAIVNGFLFVSFLLSREIILFQVDKNFLLYKQSEKYLRNE